MYNILSMRSKEQTTSAPGDRTEIEDDRTAKARIRDAAIACFADAGVDGTGVRAIAAAAGVSPGLVTHHFGSKEGLREACDRHVAALIRDLKREAISQGHMVDLSAALRSYADGPPLTRYLARMLTEGSPEVTELIDELLGNAIAYCEEAERAGMLQPTDDPRGRCVVLLLWSLGSLVLYEHVRRLLGVDLAGDPTEAWGFVGPVLEVYGRGVLTEQTYVRLREQLDAATAGKD